METKNLSKIDADDHQVLNRKIILSLGPIAYYLGMVLLMLFPKYGLSAFHIFFFGLFKGYLLMEFYGSLLIVILIIFPICNIVFYLYIKLKGNVSIITGKVEYMGSKFFRKYLLINDKEYFVSSYIYKKTKENFDIELRYLNNSKFLIRAKHEYYIYEPDDE